MKAAKSLNWILCAGLAATLAASAPAAAQQRGDDSGRKSKNGLTTQEIGEAEVKITYGRPKVRDREVWGSLVPFGKVWRSGADEATTITFSEDVKVEGQPLAAGTYALFFLPESESKWTVIFNKTARQWGAFNYKESADALRVNVTATPADHAEELTFLFDEAGDQSAQAALHWEKLKIPFKISVGSES